jgi:hypothetical protein
MRPSMLTAVLCLLAALAVRPAQAERPVARVLECSGKVMVKESAGQERSLAVFGTVYSGDCLRLPEGVSLVLAFRSTGRLERAKGPVEITTTESGCTPTESVQAVAGRQQPAGPIKNAVQSLPAVTRGGATIVRSKPSAASRPISPVHRATLLAARPTFAWTAVPDVTSYELSLRSDSGAVWSQCTEKTKLQYSGPTPLKDGRTYQWQVRAVSGQPAKAICESSFSIADAQQRATAARLEELAAGPQGPYLPLAALWYQQQRMYDQAIMAAEKLVKLAPKQAEYHALLADVLDAAGRSEDSLKSRLRADELKPPEPQKKTRKPSFIDKLRSKPKL